MTEEHTSELQSHDNLVCLEFRRVLFRSEEHTSELQSHDNLVCRLLLEKKNQHGAAPSDLSNRGGATRRCCGPSVPGGARTAGVRDHRLRGFFFLNQARPPKISPFPLRGPFPS